MVGKPQFEACDFVRSAIYGNCRGKRPFCKHYVGPLVISHMIIGFKCTLTDIGMLKCRLGSRGLGMQPTRRENDW